MSIPRVHRPRNFKYLTLVTAGIISVKAYILVFMPRLDRFCVH